VLLAHPGPDLDEKLDLVQAAVRVLDDRYRTLLAGCVLHLRSLDPIAAAIEYAETFDWRRRRTPFLTYYTAGDTRNRGVALLEFAAVYRAAGATPPPAELPDHLAVLLEFAATVDRDGGYRLLTRHRVPITLLHAGLQKASSAYAPVVAAVLLTLPPATPDDAAAVHRLAFAGPPTESVGLEPFPIPLGMPGMPARSSR